MNYESTFSKTIRQVAFYIGSFAVPVFILAVTTAIIAALPLSLSSDGDAYLGAVRANTPMVGAVQQIDLSDRWADNDETITFDHMYARN